MSEKKIIAAIGGDRRLVEATRRFARDNTVLCYGWDNCPDVCDNIKPCGRLKDAVKNADIVLLGLPCSPDGKVISENTNFDEPFEMYYYYKDGYVFHLMATNDEEYEAEVADINKNFDEAVATPFYASKINAFKQVAVGMDEEVTTYTCAGAFIFAIVGGIDRLLLIALTAYSFVLSKKAKNK